MRSTYNPYGSIPHLYVVCLGMLLGGCYRLTGYCESDQDCPQGLVCTADDTCRSSDLSTPPDLMAGSQDLLLVDATGDATPVDLYLPPGCTGEGREIRSGIFACRGNFVDGMAASLCRGTHVCGVADQNLLQNLSLSICRNPGIPGFFATAIPAQQFRIVDAEYSIQCKPTTVNISPYGLVGCGIETGAKLLVSSCGNVHVGLACGQSENWTCPTGILSSARHIGAETLGGGVLCCR